MIAAMDEHIWRRMRDAVSLGKWPDGRPLTDQQRALSLQAVIAWEVRNEIPEDQRTGYVPVKEKRPAPTRVTDDQPVAWRHPQEPENE